MPGVGVPPGGILFAAFGSGIPGVVFADGGSGLVERPGGMLFGSTFTFPIPAAFAFTLEFDSDELQAEIKIAKNRMKRLTETFDIK